MANPGMGLPIGGTLPPAGFAGTGLAGMAGNQFMTQRTPERYEQNALKWEQRGNWQKAQKNREKVWRLRNPQYGQQYNAPQFYENSRFLGYDLPYNAQQMMIPGMGAGIGGMHTQSQVLPTITETHVRQTIVEQTTRPEKIVEVQPVIHREIEAPQVHIIEKHMYETVPSTGPSVVTNQAIVQETVKPRIIEEIQPVVHREIPQTFVERVEQHVTEHIAQPTVTTKQVINDPVIHHAPVGVAAGGIGGVPIGSGAHPIGGGIGTHPIGSGAHPIGGGIGTHPIGSGAQPIGSGLGGGIGGTPNLQGNLGAHGSGLHGNLGPQGAGAQANLGGVQGNLGANNNTRI